MCGEHKWPKLSPLKTGIRGLCPRCGKGKIFDGFLTLKKECPACGLSFSFADPADGPAFFVICFGCIPSAAFACWFEVVYGPPLLDAFADQLAHYPADVHSAFTATEGLAHQ